MLTLERPCTARFNVEGCHSFLHQVLFKVKSGYFRVVIRRNAEKPYVECTTCKRRAPTEAEAVQDALRIGQEALDKVATLQDSGTDSGSWGSTTCLNKLT
jgi:hypothetical protein